MTQSRNLVTVAAVFALAWLTLPVSLLSAANTANRPHIVLVMADDQGWGDMAYYGSDVLVTPNFDKAAAAGLRLDRFYAAAPVCSPTRAGVMTGRHPNRMGVFKWGYPMRPQEITLAEALKTAGYTTAHFGKWHLGSVRNDSPANPGKNGFDHWISAPNFYDNDAILSHQGKAVKHQGESSIIAADAALDWMKANVQGDAPMLAVVWFGSPHLPHRAADEDLAHYEDLKVKSKHFLGEITGMDRAFGKLRDGLEELGIRDNTILWYTSDNGALGVGSTGGRRGHKGSIYDGGLAVPGILEWPARIKQPRTTDVRCNSCDIYPTLLEIAGVSIKNQPVIDGVSLVPLIDGEMKTRPKPMGFWDYPRGGISTPSAKWMGELLAAQKKGEDLPPHPSSANAAKLPETPYSTTQFPGHAAWIDGDWKLHRIAGKGNGNVKWELYNLGDDLAEKNNVAKDHADKVDAMGKDLEAWLASVAASLNGDDY